jgi:uncharacterized protein (UPF0305 family)
MTDVMKIRVQAASYAKTFLANKYHDEYQELYNAFLTNRGISTRKAKVLVDERLISNE